MGSEGDGTGQNPLDGPVSRPLALFDAGLTRLGSHGPFSRDLLLGVCVALVSIPPLLSAVVLAGAEGTPFAPRSSPAPGTGRTG